MRVRPQSRLEGFFIGENMQNKDSLAFAKIKQHFAIALEDAHHVKSWGDGNCGSIIKELIEQLENAGLYDPATIKSGPERKKKIPQWLRVKVFERDAYRCVHCFGWVDLCADHIVPESKGGITTLENLQTLCRSCNSKKGAKK